MSPPGRSSIWSKPWEPTADMHDEWQSGKRHYLSEPSMAELKPTSDTGGIAAINCGEETPTINSQSPPPRAAPPTFAGRRTTKRRRQLPAESGFHVASARRSEWRSTTMVASVNPRTSTFSRSQRRRARDAFHVKHLR